jgi:lipopolysaccharide transport system permease protein
MTKETLPAAALSVVRIEPTRGWVSLRLRELWTARGLLYFLVWRDIKVRYKQTVIGAAWAILQPLMAMIIFSVFFGHLAKMPSAGLPYPIFAYAGLVPWQFFSSAFTESSNSLVNNKSLITKIYFPRVVIPCAGVFAALVDFCIALLVLIGMMIYYGIAPTPRLLVVPLLVGFVVLTALAAGLWLSALNVKYRDMRYLIPFLTQFWLFATPIAYPSDIVPPAYRVVYGLNPMAGVIEGFRWAVLGTHTSIGAMVIGSVLAVILLFFTGLAYFRRTEKYFADLV